METNKQTLGEANDNFEVYSSTSLNTGADQIRPPPPLLPHLNKQT